MADTCICGKENCDGDGIWTSGIFSLENSDIVLTDTFASLICNPKYQKLVEVNIKNNVLDKCNIEMLIAVALFHKSNENAHLILKELNDENLTQFFINLLTVYHRVDIWKIGLDKYFSEKVVNQQLYDLILANSIRNVTTEDEIKARPKNIIAYLIKSVHDKKFPLVENEFDIEHVRLACIRLDVKALQLFNHYKPEYFKQLSTVKMMHSISINSSMKPFRMEMAKNLIHENDIAGAILLSVSLFDCELLEYLLTKENKPSRFKDWRLANWCHELSESVASSITGSCRSFSCYDLAFAFITFIRSPSEEIKRKISNLLLPFVNKTSIDYFKISEKR